MDIKDINRRIAVVTGATKGVSRGIARELARQGARVFITGRSVEQMALEKRISGIRCDHRSDAQVEAAFEQIAREDTLAIRSTTRH